MNRFFRQPHPTDPATIGNTLHDALAGIMIVAIVVVGIMWCA